MEKEIMEQLPVGISGDPLFEEAVRVVLATGWASATLLQRKLKLSYARAARLLDEMEEKGVVGPFAAGQPREILVTQRQVTLPEKQETARCSSEAEDPLLGEAFAVVLAAGYASASMLQRELKLPYARAARLIDEMEEKGLVGPFAGGQPREIRVTRAQWDAMQKPDTP